VRVALGNTGSKTTIHKYLKELEEEGDGVDGRKSALSDTLQDFVAQLAAQLQEEANVRVVEIQTESASKDLRHEQVVDALKVEVARLSSKLKLVETEAVQQKSTHEFTIEELHRETIARRMLEQQVSDLRERLVENEQHRQSLEEKHIQARDALEHYRSSVKEQRDQDQRRHEQQIQQMQAEIRQLQLNLVARQDDLTRLNQEGARLVADLSHAQSNLYEQQTRSRQLEKKLETLQAIELRAKAVEARFAEREQLVLDQREQLHALIANAAEQSKQVRDLELALAASNAKLSAQQVLVAEIRNYMDNRPLKHS